MPRDYKHRATRKRKKTGPAPWVWLVTGLAIGLFAALLVFLQMQPQPAATRPAEPVALPRAEDARDVRKKDSKPIPPPPRPRFDFYNLLPEMEVVIPEQEITGVKKEGIKQVEKPGTYLLQAGSFRSFDQADQLKARLAMLGLETRVDSVTTDNGEWHRVRVGPYKKLEDLNASRSQLKRNGIDAILIRLKK